MIDILNRRDKRTHGQRAEKKAASRLGAVLTPGSGAIQGMKGDFRTATFMVENKSTVNASLSLKKDWLEKIAREALDHGKSPALFLQFVNASGESNVDDRWVMIREIDFQGMIE